MCSCLRISDPHGAWDAGYDGRRVLDPLCEAAGELLADRGTLLIVQSEFAGPRQTIATLASSGLDAEVIAWQWIPFDPVLSSRAPAGGDRSTPARPL